MWSSIDIANGSVPKGSVRYGTLGHISSVWVLGTTQQGALPIDIDRARANIGEAVASINETPANGTWSNVNPWWTTLRFHGVDPGVNVFDIDVDDLASARAIVVGVPSGAGAVIRVHGGTYSTSQLSSITLLNSNDPSRLLWIYPDASTITIGPSLEWRGSIVAPSATVSVLNSVPVRGSIIAQSVQGAVTHLVRAPAAGLRLP